MLEELFDMMKENCQGDEKQIIELGNELIEYISTSRDFAGELSDRLEEFAKQNDRCPLCGRELEVKTFYQESEFQGFPVKEGIGEAFCPNCGTID